MDALQYLLIALLIWPEAMAVALQIAGLVIMLIVTGLSVAAAGIMYGARAAIGWAIARGIHGRRGE